MKKMTGKIIEQYKKCGLGINISKTKYKNTGSIKQDRITKEKIHTRQTPDLPE